jgi:thiamine biosynthesis lipoprotein
MCIKKLSGVKRHIVLFATILSTAGCAGYGKNPANRTEFLLGTTCTLSIYERPPEGIFDRVFQRIGQIEARMSAQKETSELSAVNRAAGQAPVRVSPDTFQVIARGLEFARLSRGVFDISIGPLVNLWGIGTEQAHIPPEAEIEEARRLVGYRDVVLNEREQTVFLKRAGMRLDLGGIAKGYAADESARILREAGVRHALIALGGNIYALDHKPDGALWKVGIQNPEDQRGAYMGILEVAGKTVVTSGTYERFFEEGGVRYHHILDPRTGHPVRNSLSSVTILSEDSTAADALSTSVFALGVEDGLALVESLPGVEAVLITGDHRVIATAGIRGSLRIVDPGYRAAEATAARRTGRE